MPFYTKNQLVWAKVKGYPWWPAIVAKSNQSRNGFLEDEVLVNFIGENSHATLSIDKIANFEEEFEQHSITKNKKLIESIKIAERISQKISTYEEEKTKMLKKAQREDSDDSKPEKEPKKLKIESNKGIAKSNKKISRIAQKLKNKESLNSKEYKNLEEFIPHRFTRSRSKQENVEMLTEPLIYPSRKNQASPVKDLNRGSIKGYIKRTNSKATLNKTRTRSESTKSATQIETKSTVMRKRTEKIFEKPSGRRMSLRRKGKMEEENEEEEQEKEKDADDENNEEEKKIEKKPTKSRRGQHLRKGARQKNKDIEKPKENERDLELEEMLQDVDEDDGSFDIIEDSLETGEGSRTKNHKMKNTKRLTSRENDHHSPKYMTQFLNRDSKSIMSENEHIFKKIKIDEGFAHSSTKIGISYKSLKIKKLEGDLEKNLYKLSTKFQKKEKLKEEDEESTQLSNITREFENNSLSGAEYIGSDIGKIIKTIHFLLTKNTDLLHKTDETLLPALDRVLRKIEAKIVQYCLDNTEYINSLNLFENSKDAILEEATPKKAEEVMIKLDEQNSESDNHLPVLNLEENSLMSTKMEEEEHRGAQGTPMKTHIIKEDSIHMNSNFERNEEKVGHSQIKQDQTQKPKGGQHLNHYERRKKICQKFAALLQRVYAMEKNKSQELTLVIEDKINNFHINAVNEYKNAIKELLKIIKANKIDADELIQIQTMGINEFTSMRKQKLETVINVIDSPENSISTIPEKRTESINLNNNNTNNNNTNSLKREKNGDSNSTPRKSLRISKKGGVEANVTNDLYNSNYKGEAH